MKKILFALGLLLSVALSPNLVAAAPNLGLDLTSKIATQSGYDPANDTTLAQTVGKIIKGALSALGVIFLVLMVYAGFLYLTSAGDSEKKKKSIDIITAAVIGLIIVLSAYAITTFVLTKLGSATGSSSSGSSSSGSGSSSSSGSQNGSSNNNLSNNNGGNGGNLNCAGSCLTSAQLNAASDRTQDSDGVCDDPALICTMTKPSGNAFVQGSVCLTRCMRKDDAASKGLMPLLGYVCSNIDEVCVNKQTCEEALGECVKSDGMLAGRKIVYDADGNTIKCSMAGYACVEPAEPAPTNQCGINILDGSPDQSEECMDTNLVAVLGAEKTDGTCGSGQTCVQTAGHKFLCNSDSLARFFIETNPAGNSTECNDTKCFPTNQLAGSNLEKVNMGVCRTATDSCVFSMPRTNQFAKDACKTGNGAISL